MTVHVSESGARHAYTTLAGDRETSWISMYAIARRTAPSRRDSDVLGDRAVLWAAVICQFISDSGARVPFRDFRKFLKFLTNDERDSSMRFFRALLVDVAVSAVGWMLYLVANVRIPGVAETADYLIAHAEKVTPMTADDMYLGAVVLWGLVLVALWYVLCGSRTSGRVAVDAPGSGWEPVELPTPSRFSGRGRS